MIMYLQFINDIFKTFETLPFQIRLADGMTRTSLFELTTEQLEVLGLFEYQDVTEAYDPTLKRPTGNITFDHDAKTFVRMLEDIPIPEPVAKQFTQLEYQSLYTLDELVAIETAAETNPTLRVLQRMQQSATYISLADQRTIQGMQLLVSLSLLTSERYTEILSHCYDD